MPHPSFQPRHPYSPGDWRRDPSRESPRDRGADRARVRRHARRARRVIRAIILLGIAGALIGGIVLAALFAVASRDLPDPGRLISRTVPQSTKILDRTGTRVLYELHGEEQRTWRPLAEIAPHVRWATVAIEDKRFYAHEGFRITSFVRAALANLTAGANVQGASTITQQLVKNAILTPEKTYRRKLRELLLAYRIEQRFSKDEILELYLNEIPFGATAYGVEAAARVYFGKGAHELDLAESALLAALPKAPTRLSPYGSHTDELIARQHLVLDLMAVQQYLTPDEAAAAKRVEVLARVKPRRDAITAPHFVMWVRELLTERYGERAVEAGGLVVTTTLDADLQTKAEEAVAKFGERNAVKYRASNAALVAIHPANGHVLAMVGSRDFFDEAIDGQVNVALRPRQPGSSFKPVVYAAALAHGYTPDTLLADVATTFPTSVGDYEPADYDGKERGLVTLRTALAGSLNIPAVQVLELIGVDRALDFAERLGYTTLRDRSRFGLALVLGGGEVTLLDHTAAFAALAQDGIRRPSVAILKVAGPGGATLEEWQPSNGTRSLDAEPVRQLTSILTDNAARTFMFGARSPLAFTDRPVAAKTGTTNDWRDAWTMGFTPSLATGVWVGNNNNRPMAPKSDGSFVAAPIWRAFMDAALAKTPVETFPAPQPVVVEKPVLRGEIPPVVRVRVDRATGLAATDATPPELVEERAYQDLRPILHTVRRDDPRGPVPENPGADPMYGAYAAALRRWAEKQRIVVGVPPTATEAVDPDRPVVTLAAPMSGAAVDGRDVVVEGTVAAPRGVTRMTAHVDGVAAALFAPSDGGFRHAVRLPASIGRGSHELRVTAFDATGAAGSAIIALDVRSDREPVALAWEAPPNGAVFARTVFPVTLALRATASSGANRLEILLTDADGERILTSVVPSSDGGVRVLWPTAPLPGTVTLRARLLVGDTLLAESEPLGLRIE